MGDREYFVVWDIADRTHVKSFTSRYVTFERFKLLSANPAVVMVEMQKPNGCVLHRFERASFVTEPGRGIAKRLASLSNTLRGNR